jgi:hypothetical protein
MSLRADVDRGLEILAEIKKLQTELKNIETRLEMAGLQAGQRGEHQPLQDADRGGKCWFAHGSDQDVPLIFTDDKLIGSFTAESKVHKTILAVAAGKLPEFFKPVNKFEAVFDDGKKFRKHAFEIFGEQAPAFITACVARDKAGIAKSDVKICWADARKEEK